MSLIKMATPGAGFARLQQLGLAEKAVAKYGKTDWLKNAAKPIVKKIEQEVPKVIPVNPWSVR